jgi:hypothetical protein
VRRGDVTALVASSIAVASAIGSPPLHKNHPPPPVKNNSYRGTDSAWQTAYNAARMVVEIAKESSDMFLPLKTVVGALSVLIKNYDVSPPQ